MATPHDDDALDLRNEVRDASTALCPRCGVKRIGAFRSCLSCGYDYEAPKAPVFGPPPADGEVPPLIKPETSTTAPHASSTAGVWPAQVRAAAPVPTPPLTQAPVLAAEVTRLAAPAAMPPAEPTPDPSDSPAKVEAAPSEPLAASPPGSSTIARQGQRTRRADRTLGSRERRLAVAALAVVPLAAVAIVALANGFGRAGAVLQASLAPTAAAVPLPSINQACAQQVGPFVSSLTSLDAAVGPDLTFKDYAQMIAATLAARGQIKIAQLDPPCIAVFAAAQAVLGDHAEAYNAWNDCNTISSCTKTSIESSLEAHWATARATLSAVKASMP